MHTALPSAIRLAGAVSDAGAPLAHLAASRARTETRVLYQRPLSRPRCVIWQQGLRLESLTRRLLDGCAWHVLWYAVARGRCPVPAARRCGGLLVQPGSSMADDDGASMDGGLSPLDPEAPAETPEDWKAFVDFQPNGRVLRSSPVMAGGDIDLWSPDGACEEMLIDQNAVQVRKRQDDGRCRVDGCERQAPKAPFLCEYHATGEFYTVAVMDVERGGSRCAGGRGPGRPVPWKQGGSRSNATCRLCRVSGGSTSNCANDCPSTGSTSRTSLARRMGSSTSPVACAA